MDYSKAVKKLKKSLGLSDKELGKMLGYLQILYGTGQAVALLQREQKRLLLIKNY